MNLYNSESVQEISPISDFFLISWHVTGWCNFHCPYCIDGKGKSALNSIESVKEMTEKINIFIENNVDSSKSVKLRLYGGEPSIYPWPNILEKITRLNSLVLPTNFSNSLNYYKELYLYCYKRKIKLILNCSCHPEAKDFVAKIIELTNWCRQQKAKGIHILEPIVTFVVDDSFNFNIINELETNRVDKIKLTVKRDLNNKKIEICDFLKKKVLEYNKKYQKLYPYPQLKIVFDNGIEAKYINSTSLISKFNDGGFDPTGFYCNAGVNSIAIESNGDVLLARCDYLRQKRIGNIYDDNFKLKKDIFRCELNKNSNDSRCALCFNTIIRRE